MYVCGTDGDFRTWTWSGTSCDGSPLGSTPFTATAITLNITDYTINCCSDDQCSYALDSNGDDQIIGACEGAFGFNFKYTACSNGKLTKNSYLSTTSDCSGDPLSISNETGATCGLTAIDTCSADYNSKASSVTASSLWCIMCFVAIFILSF